MSKMTEVSFHMGKTVAYIPGSDVIRFRGKDVEILTLWENGSNGALIQSECGFSVPVDADEDGMIKVLDMNENSDHRLLRVWIQWSE